MICFAWAGFPQYAARCVREVVKAANEKVVVVGSRPTVPIKGMDELCGCDVFWVDDNDKVALSDLLGGELPRALYTTGWSVRLFNSFRDEVSRNGGKAICMVDNNFLDGGSSLTVRRWRNRALEMAKAVRFQFAFRRKYDAFLVPGASGRRLMSFYGVKQSIVRDGMYAADDSLFTAGAPITARPKTILYVGQYIERKNVLRMVDAFSAAALSSKKGYSLELYGSGVLKERLVARASELNVALARVGSSISVNDFVQPEELSVLYHAARTFCLPSYEDHWGLVVHEAALSGCLLLLSQYVGAAEDFLVPKKDGHGHVNGSAFDPYSTKSMQLAFEKVMGIDDAEAVCAQGESLRVAQSASTRKFAKAVLELCDSGQ